MNPVIRNILAVFAGAVVCVLLNSLLLGLLMGLMGTPSGFDPRDPSTYGLLQAKHYVAPFLAHALPSFIGGALAAWLAASRRMAMALAVGALHMIGGIAAAIMIPAPDLFILADLSLAYLPMAWLGGKLVMRTVR
jgi:hypothetical protein